MFDTELIRIGLVFGILAVNSFTDLKSRIIFGSDKLYLILGIAGLSLLVIDGINLPTIFMIVLNVTIIAIFWRLGSVLASGDLVVYLMLSFTLPMHALFMVIGGFFFQVLFGLSYNWILNIQTLQDNKPLFSQYKESILKKILAFSLFHQKRNWEKHVISVESGEGFSINTKIMDKEFDVKSGLVVSAFPFIPFMLFVFTLHVIIQLY